jgi:integrase
MFERFFCEPRCLRRYREGPMKAEREEFLRYIVAEGRSDLTIRQVMLPNRRSDARTLRKRRTTFLGHARIWLRFIGRFKEKAPLQPFGEELERFIEFGRRERGLASETCKYQRRVAREFFNWFASNVGDDLSKLQVTHVLSFAQQASFARKSRPYAVGSIGSLRVLLRWMVQHGLCSKALSSAFRRREVQELVASTVGDSIQHLRDRAILLLLAIYGLRVGEIRSLRLEDIDWENETIRPPRPKQRKVGIYPLIREVGDAIIAYLRVRFAMPVSSDLHYLAPTVSLTERVCCDFHCQESATAPGAQAQAIRRARAAACLRHLSFVRRVHPQTNRGSLRAHDDPRDRSICESRSSVASAGRHTLITGVLLESAFMANKFACDHSAGRWETWK